MLIPKNNANQMRTRILIKIAESYFADKFKNADRIPLELRPKEQQPSIFRHMLLNRSECHRNG